MPDEQKIIVDTSCLIVLSRCGILEILKDLYQTVVITPEVADEFGLPLPTWFKLHSAEALSFPADMMTGLGAGEKSSIALALELSNSFLIIDDLKGRLTAQQLGIPITGTLGILYKAWENGIVENLEEQLQQFISQGFHISPALLDQLLERK